MPLKMFALGIVKVISEKSMVHSTEMRRALMMHVLFLVRQKHAMKVQRLTYKIATPKTETRVTFLYVAICSR
jgi:hypothetical protein